MNEFSLEINIPDEAKAHEKDIANALETLIDDAGHYVSGELGLKDLAEGFQAFIEIIQEMRQGDETSPTGWRWK